MSRNRQAHREYQRHYRRRPHARYADYRNDAQAKGRAFELTLEQFVAIIEQPCYYCRRTPEEQVIGVDRRNNEPYYRVENSVPCCKPCNLAKRTMSAKDFMALAEAVTVESYSDYYERYYQYCGEM
jgi:hypothetical protein